MRTIDSNYYSKDQSYFENVRHDIISLLPKDIDRVLEIGCGVGNTLSFLKASDRCVWAAGCEIFHDAVESARKKNIDFVLEGNIETDVLPFKDSSFDAILCLDILEHLVDPWSVIHRLHVLLKPGGAMICSIPNVRNFRVVLPLLLFGRWQYVECGILDKTLLRIFTKKTAMALVECSGLRIDSIRATGLASKKSSIANGLTMSLLKPFFELQYLIRAIKIA